VQFPLAVGWAEQRAGVQEVRAVEEESLLLFESLLLLDFVGGRQFHLGWVKAQE